MPANQNASNFRHACQPVSHHQELNTGLKLLFSKGTEYDSLQIYATPRPDQSAEIAEFGILKIILWLVSGYSTATVRRYYSTLSRVLQQTATHRYEIASTLPGFPSAYTVNTAETADTVVDTTCWHRFPKRDIEAGQPL